MKNVYVISVLTLAVGSIGMMNTAIAGTVATAPVAVVASAPVKATAPDVFVKGVADALVEKLKTQRSAYKKNPAILATIVQQNIEPYVDFDGFARGVMGKYANQATPAQRTLFTQTFKTSLLNTYTKSLASFDNEGYSIRPVAPSTTPSKAVVVMDFKTDKGTVIPITYQMIQIAGGWKVRNVQLNGIDVGQSFNKEFIANVQKNKGNLDLAIKTFVPSDATK